MGCRLGWAVWLRSGEVLRAAMLRAGVSAA